MSETRTDAVDQLNARQAGFNLFLVGFLVLFLELACILGLLLTSSSCNSSQTSCLSPASSGCHVVAWQRARIGIGSHIFHLSPLERSSRRVQY